MFGMCTGYRFQIGVGGNMPVCERVNSKKSKHIRKNVQSTDRDTHLGAQQHTQQSNYYQRYLHARDRVSSRYFSIAF